MTDSTEGRSELVEAAEAAATTTAYDRFIEGSTDLIEIIPILGNLVSAITRQLVTKDHEIYLRSYLVDVAKRLEQLDETKIDRSYVQSEEWMGDVQQSVEALAFRRNRDKRDHFVAALANAATTDRPDDVERHRFLDLLEVIRPSHLRLLAVLATAGETDVGGGADGYLMARLPDQDLENIRLDWRDLEQAGLLNAIPGGMTVTPIDKLMASALKAIGERFVAFVDAVPPDTEEPLSPAV
jgi:hypothetical protein